MDKIIAETIPFYNMLLWLNMRTNAENNMVLGSSVLEDTPFKGTIKNSGLEEIVKFLSN